MQMPKGQYCCLPGAQDSGVWEELLRFPERRDTVQGPAKELSAVRTELFWPGR